MVNSYILATLCMGTTLCLTECQMDWQPPDGIGMSREEFLANHGMTQSQFERIRDLSRQLKGLMTIEAVKNNGDEFFGDVTFVESELEHLIDRYKHVNARKVVDFNLYSPYPKWTGQVVHGFHGSHDLSEIETIQSAIQQWEDKTCLRFEEHSGHDPDDGIIFRNIKGDGCSTYGMASNDSSIIIKLQTERCPLYSEIVADEISLLYEHGRDVYITILIQRDVTYSISTVFAINPVPHSSYETIDPVIKPTVLYPDGLPFIYWKLANIKYCTDKCSRLLSCERGGYTDPKNCSRCRCPEGFGGTYCNEVAPSIEPAAGEVEEKTSTNNGTNLETSDGGAGNISTSTTGSETNGGVTNSDIESATTEMVAQATEAREPL